MNPHYRHGDLLITAITSKIPEHATPVEPVLEKLVLAEGEVTGHLHEVPADHATLFVGNLISNEQVEELREMWLQVSEESVLTHPEHGPILLPTGDYIVTRQREYAPEAIRVVAD